MNISRMTILRIFYWIRNPFDVEMSDLAGRELDQLAELSCDRTLKIQFREKSLSDFWLSVSTISAVVEQGSELFVTNCDNIFV